MSNNLSIATRNVVEYIASMQSIKQNKINECGEREKKTHWQKADDLKIKQFAISMKDNIRGYTEKDIRGLVKCHKIINHQGHSTIVDKWTNTLKDEMELMDCENEYYFNKGFIAKHCPELNLINVAYEEDQAFKQVLSMVAAEEALEEKNRQLQIEAEAALNTILEEQYRIYNLTIEAREKEADHIEAIHINDTEYRVDWTVSKNHFIKTIGGKTQSQRLQERMMETSD